MNTILNHAITQISHYQTRHTKCTTNARIHTITSSIIDKLRNNGEKKQSVLVPLDRPLCLEDLNIITLHGAAKDIKSIVGALFICDLGLLSALWVYM